VRRTLAALQGSTVKRVIFLSYVGADRSARNDYLRTKGQAEDLLYRSGRNVVIFRCSHIYGPPEDPGPMVSALLARRRETVSVLGDGAQLIAPVYREDVVEAILRAGLDCRAPIGRFDLCGPEVMTLDEFVHTVNTGDTRIRHIPAALARALGHLQPGLTPALVDVLLADSIGERRRVERVFGLTRHRLRDVYLRLAVNA
jgi:nucleoside-diphosphate-sugar epimerase